MERVNGLKDRGTRRDEVLYDEAVLARLVIAFNRLFRAIVLSVHMSTSHNCDKCDKSDNVFHDQAVLARLVVALLRAVVLDITTTT